MPNLVGIGLSQVPTNSMLGGLAYQDPEYASIKDLDLKNLSQINSEIADTAVDVFVYDTRKDSDGGAWRKRTQHTSWYNETLGTGVRGTRKEFPSVAVIVAESNPNKVTIYDGDDPDLPMWMVFNASTNTNANFLAVAGQTLSSIFMLNGELGIGFPSSNGWGLNRVNFLSDSQGWYWTTATIYKQVKNSIAERNDQNGYYNSGSGVSGLSNARVNDIAMKVLPNAPIDDSTGLPVPTIALGTEGGVSIIRDNGTVVTDITGTSQGSDAPVDMISFVGNDKIMYSHRYASEINTIISSDVTAQYYNQTSSWLGRISNSISHDSTTVVSALSSDDNIESIALTETFAASKSVSGLSLANNYAIENDPDRASCFITTDYNTGWMNGDIKGAFLSDTDTTNLSGGNKVTNGDSWSGAQSSQSSTAPTGWTGGNGATWKTETGNGANGTYIRLYNENNGGDGPNSYMYQAITTVTGKKYKISLTQIHHATISVYYRVGTSINGSELISGSFNSSSGNTPRYLQNTFTATGTTTYISLGIISGTHNYGVGWDDVIVTEFDEDRSVNADGLHSYGTITKSAVATGAELVAYDGFGNSNYLEQPYNTDLNFGTGDFSLMNWIYVTAGSDYQVVFDRWSYSGNARFYFGLQTDEKIYFHHREDSSANATDLTGSTVLTAGVWHHMAAVRRGTSVEVYLNGKLDNSATSTIRNVTPGSTKPTLRIGTNNVSSPSDPMLSKLALLRISGSAPSPEQIKKMYEDEKVLFQENAKATLYGSSDAVTALAYDDSTNLLYAGTSSGRSEFQGLRRINNTTEAVTTAISASNGLVAEQ